MNIIPQPWRIVLIPRPLSPMAAFAYWVLIRSGNAELLAQCHFPKWTTLNMRSWLQTGVQPFADIGVVIDLNVSSRDLEILIDAVIFQKFQACQPAIARKMKNFFLFYGRKRQHAWSLWLQYLGRLSYYDDPSKALEHLCTTMDDVVKLDGLAESSVITSEIETYQNRRASEEEDFFLAPRELGTRVVSMPISKHDEMLADEAERRIVTDQTTQRLNEGNAFELLGDSSTLLVGGCAGVGKSTLAAAMVDEFRNTIESLTSRGGTWKGFNLKSELVPLDVATQVSDAVLHGEGQHEDVLDARKREWNASLALHAATNLVEAVQRNTLVVSDLPGKLTEFTELIVPRGDFGIIITRHDKWKEDNRDWGAYYARMGVNVVAQLKITRGQSLLLDLRHGRGATARLHKPDRVLKGWDPAIRTLAEFLMFNILPAYKQRLFDKIDAQARGEEV
ncbi:MAG: hypothetical protein V4526_01970 [Patescibacteria group bacterium]